MKQIFIVALFHFVSTNVNGDEIRWQLGAQGESCTATCAAISLPCDESALTQSFTAETIEEIALSATDAGCVDTQPWGYASSPGICTNSGCCGGDCVGTCVYGNHAGQSCDAKYSPYSRLCPCLIEGGWILGAQGESCTQTCAKEGRVCDLTETTQDFTEASVSEAAQEADASCDGTAGWAYESSPGICTDSGCCGGSCVGICAFGSYGEPSCDGSNNHYSRLCYCVDEPSVPTEAPPTEVPTEAPPTESPVPTEKLSPGSWHWSSHSNQNVASAGFTFYTHIFQLWQEGHPLHMQMGMAGAWITPHDVDFSESCACNPNGWPSTTPGDPSFGCCNNAAGCGWLYQTFEGGPGFWIGELPTVEPKYRINSATGCYAQQTSTSLFSFGNTGTKSCSELGIIQVSNRLILAPDGLTFDKKAMLGTGYVTTPIGKISATDDRNSWTFVVDSKTFSGPVMYFLPEFFETRATGSSADLEDFGTPGLEGSMGGGGFEWNSLRTWTDGSAYRIPKMNFPQRNGRSVLMMNNRKYDDSTPMQVLDAALNSGSLNAADILSNGTRSSCFSASSNARYRVASNKDASLGAVRTTIENGECVYALEYPNDAQFDKVGGDAAVFFSSDGEPLDESEVSASLRDSEFNVKTSWGTYNAINNPPSGGCATSDQPLYCVQTRSPSWVGYKWYKFTEQPGFDRVDLTDAQKAYLQARIENLHAILNADDANGRWIPRDGAVEDEGLAEIEASLLVSPPAGMEVGYVPIPIYEGLSKPSGCTE